MTAFLALLGAGLTVAACYSLGSALVWRLGALLDRREQFPLAFVLGAAVLHLAVFVLMAFRLAYQPALVTLLMAAVACGIVMQTWRLPPASKLPPSKLPRPKNPVERFAGYLFAGITGVFSALYYFNAWAPEISPDGSAYHLSLIARYLRAHGLEVVRTNVRSSFSEGVETVFAPAVSIGGYSAAALVHLAFLIALALAVASYGRRIGRPFAGSAAALLVYLSPVVGIDATIAYVDVATAAIVFSVFYWTQIWDQERNGRLLFAIGLLAGYCYAAKYTAYVMLFYAAGFVFWQSRKLRPAFLLIATSLVMAGPWLIRDWLFWGNPIAPFGNRLFQNPNIHIEFERVWSAGVRTYGLQNLWTLPMEVTLHGETTQGLLGPVFLAAPLALLALRTRDGRRILAPCVLLLATYFDNIGTRFLIPCVPFVALAMATALESATPILAMLVAAHAVLSSPPVIEKYSHAWALHEVPIYAALRITPEDAYLRRNSDYLWARMIEEYVPPGERVFVRTSVAASYTKRDVVMGWEGAFNEELQDIYDVGWDLARYPAKQWNFSLPPGRWRKLILVQTGMPKYAGEQWSIHEVKFLRAGSEVAPGSHWQLRASPNQWGVRLAFDGSGATRWRSWETLRPGMYLELDFDGEEAIDQMQVELSDEEWNVSMQARGMNEQGRWSVFPARIEQKQPQVSSALRKAASAAFHARGIHYLLLKDDDWGAKHVAEDPASWGMNLLIHAYGASLYAVDTPGGVPSLATPNLITNAR